MIISFSGTHSSGKTTLLKLLKSNSYFKDYAVYDLITRNLQRKGKKINELGNDDTQLAIFNSHISNLIDDNDNKLMDRCILDGIVYTHYLYNQGKVSLSMFNLALEAFKCLISYYDIILYLEPEVDIEDDGVRSTNVSFQKDIQLLFRFYITEYKVSHYRILGTIQQRYDCIMDLLTEGVLLNEF